MILSSNTARTVIIPSTGLDKSDTAKETAFQMGGSAHSFVLDGRVEDSIQKAMLDPDKAFTSLDQLSNLCKDEGGSLAKAGRLLADGAETVKVDVGQANKWTAKAADKPGVIELSNDAGLSSEQSIRVGGGYISLNTRPSLLDKNESVSQKIVGKFNAQNGTITCVREEIENTTSQEAAAPLAPPAPPAPPAAPPRAGEVVSSPDIDAKVFGPVSQEIGADKVFSGFGDENLNRFADWALGKNDLPFGSALQALPQGWSEMGSFDYHAEGPGDNYTIGTPGGSYQVLNVNKETGDVKLVTSYEYRRPTDFEGSFEKVSLTRYADGEIRREFQEMHD